MPHPSRPACRLADTGDSQLRVNSGHCDRRRAANCGPRMAQIAFRPCKPPNNLKDGVAVLRVNYIETGVVFPYARANVPALILIGLGWFWGHGACCTT